MPPIKGRMMGRIGAIASVQQSTKQIRNVQKTTIARRKYKSSPVKPSSLPDNIKEDRKLMAMRMPEDIVRILPSVKKYKGSKDFVDLTDGISSGGESRSTSRAESEVESVSACGAIIGLSHRGRGLNKYAMKQLAEERFMGIIFDVGVSPNGDVFVSCCEGVYMCDTSLERKLKLDQVILPGGVAFFDDGRIVVICRNQDTVNFFSKDGVFIKAFKGGFSPMGLVINSKNELLVSDPGAKCVHVFNSNGETLYTYPATGKGYSFRWPLYMGLLQDDNVLICDCHSQNVVKFGPDNNHMYTYKLKTTCGNEVLRPHGIAANQDGDLFIVDTTMDTVEVFADSDSYLQTLINSEEGSRVKPKCLALSPKGLFVVGGRLGMVRVYEFLDYADMESKSDFEKTPFKHEPNSKTPHSKSSSAKRSSDKAAKKTDLSKVKRNVFKTEPELVVKEDSESVVKEESEESNTATDSKGEVIVLE